MKKILMVICCVCPLSVAFGADMWDEQYTWSYDALADTLVNMNDGCESAGSDVLLKLNDFVNEHNAKLSVRELVDKCVEVAGSKSCGISDNANIDSWTQTVGNQQNEFCDVFVSDFIDNHNNVVNKQTSTLSYWGCNDYTGIIRDGSVCNSRFASNTTEKTRCQNCIGVAGTYENGRCYIEIDGWHCKGRGWNTSTKVKQNPAPCDEKNKYQGCRLVRVYVDVEKRFTCDLSTVAPAGFVLSGCAPHGWSSYDKHPPFSLDGDKYQPQSCKLPLSANNDWRVTYSTGSAINFKYNGISTTTSNWCMPSNRSIPWNEANHFDKNPKVNAKLPRHLNKNKVVIGGETIDYWYSI